MGRNVIINTHSPYLLSALNISILAAKISKIKELKNDADAIVPPQFQIDYDDVAVYSLGEDPYCKSIIDKKTGLVSVNYLDVISEALSSDFGKLYQLYLNILQK